MAQPNGLEAVGFDVCRDFGQDGFFEGTVVGFEFDAQGDSLYCIEYTDGDKEDLDQEEFNYAYALHMKRQGWDLIDGASKGEGGGTQTRRVRLATVTRTVLQMFGLSKFCCEVSV